MRFSSIQHFAIDEWGFVYWEAGRNKLVSECRFNEIFLEDN